MSSSSRSTHWLLGSAFGALAGGFMLEAGVLAALLIAPALVWSWREVHRPLGLAGFVSGIGVGWAVLLAWADGRCALDPSCSMPDLTGYFVLAGALMLAAAVLTFLGTEATPEMSRQPGLALHSASPPLRTLRGRHGSRLACAPLPSPRRPTGAQRPPVAFG